MAAGLTSETQEISGEELVAARTKKVGLAAAQDFPLLSRQSNGKPFRYLDNSATSQKPRAVIEAMSSYYGSFNANVHRGIYRIAQEATLEYEKAHDVVAQFIGGQAEEVIFTRGTTDSLNLLAFSLAKQLREGDEILLTEMEHHSNIVPWQQVAKERKAILKYIPVSEEGTLLMEKAREMITTKTRIVSVTHISNVLGSINPVQEVASLAHEVGALLIVDAAQSIPHMPIDVTNLGCDFLAFSGHKMLGPMGIGVLWGRKQLLEDLEPYQYGGDMIREVRFDGATWNDLPWKFEAGTPNVPGALGLMKAIEYLQDIGMENIQQHTSEVTKYAQEELQKIPGLVILGPARRGPLVAFTMAGIHPHDIAELLDKENIAIRAGHHCAMPLHKKLGLGGSTRASFSIYNTKEDVDALVLGLHHVRKVFQ